MGQGSCRESLGNRYLEIQQPGGANETRLGVPHPTKNAELRHTLTVILTPNMHDSGSLSLSLQVTVSLGHYIPTRASEQLELSSRNTKIIPEARFEGFADNLELATRTPSHTFRVYNLTCLIPFQSSALEQSKTQQI